MTSQQTVNVTSEALAAVDDSRGVRQASSRFSLAQQELSLSAPMTFTYK